MIIFDEVVGNCVVSCRFYDKRIKINIKIDRYCYTDILFVMYKLLTVNIEKIERT